MFRGLSDRLAVILTLITLFVTMTLCMCYVAIFVSPELPLNPFPPSQAMDMESAVADTGTSAGLPSPVVIEVNSRP